MKGNNKDCICENPDGKHRKYCDAYRLSEFMKKVAHVKKENKSDCCQKPMKVVSGDEGTSYYECTECLKPCDQYVPDINNLEELAHAYQEHQSQNIPSEDKEAYNKGYWDAMELARDFMEYHYGDQEQSDNNQWHGI